MIKPENYITIQGWMVTEFHLKGNELMIYAILYGFTQDDSWFRGSAQYLADWVSTTKQTVYTVLSSLVDKGLIEKRERIENAVKLCDYRVKNLTGVVKNFNRGTQNISVPGTQKSNAHNTNTDINKKTNRENNLHDIYGKIGTWV